MKGFKERKRRHDDAHFPMGGRGKRATPPVNRLVSDNEMNKRKCPSCARLILIGQTLCECGMSEDGDADGFD